MAVLLLQAARQLQYFPHPANLLHRYLANQPLYIAAKAVYVVSVIAGDPLQ